MTNEEKLENLIQFLQENNLRCKKNYHSRTFDIDIDLKVEKLLIAVFLSDGDHEKETSLVLTPRITSGAPLRNIYHPFFIRESESVEYVIEKMKSCIVERMIFMQKKWQKKQAYKQSQDGEL
jgi:hypothetical protein